MLTEERVQIEVEVCTAMLREAFRALRDTEQFYQVNRKEVASYEWNSLIQRIKTNGFFYLGHIRCVAPTNIANYIRDIEEIRLKVFKEGCKRKYQ